MEIFYEKVEVYEKGNIAIGSREEQQRQQTRQAAKGNRKQEARVDEEEDTILWTFLKVKKVKDTACFSASPPRPLDFVTMLSSRRFRNCGPNGWVLVIGGMLALFAVAIALAVMFPYQGVPDPTIAVEAQTSAAVELGGVEESLQSDSVVDSGGAHSAEKTAGTHNEEIVIMKKGQITTEGKVETEASSGGGLFSHREPANESPQVAEPEDEQEACTSLLQEADIDESKILSTSEYVSLLHSMHSSNILSLQNLSDEYASLSFGLRLNFLHQQCKCPQALPECCENEKGVYVGDESATAEFCRTTIEVGLEGKVKR